jgi:hypothetical protein
MRRYDRLPPWKDVPGMASNEETLRLRRPVRPGRVVLTLANLVSAALIIWLWLRLEDLMWMFPILSGGSYPVEYLLEDIFRLGLAIGGLALAALGTALYMTVVGIVNAIAFLLVLRAQERPWTLARALYAALLIAGIAAAVLLVVVLVVVLFV